MRACVRAGVVSRTIGIMPEKALKMQAWIQVGRYFSEDATYSKWIIAGSAAGAATTLVGMNEYIQYHCQLTSPPHSSFPGCPSERIMVLAQIQRKGVRDVIRDTGIKGLLNGWQATLYRDILFNCIFFTSREMFVRHYKHKYGEEPAAFKRVLIGWPAGCLASVAACPLDVIKTRIQGKELGKKEMLLCC